MTRFLVLLFVLGNASASVAQSVERVAYDYTAMYEAVSPSIVKVHTDSGSGSGFLISASGMFATNHHVVRNSRYVAVEFTDGRKVPADVITLNPQYDLAILKVNRQYTQEMKPLPLLDASSDGTIKAGIPVVAFGSPLSQTFLMTQGIVSKVEDGVLLGDFVIEPGNSGGPLLNLAGEVIGVNTFGIRNVSGAVRVGLLRQIISDPVVSNYSGPEPDAVLLPTADRQRYPTHILKRKVLAEPLNIADYTAEGGRFTVTAYTPVLISKINVQPDLQQAANRYARRGRKIKDEKFDPTDEPFYEWVRNADSYLDSLVTLEVRPDVGATAGSIWAAALVGAAAGFSGVPALMPKETLEFKAEFQEMKLLRDGRLVQPVTPGRQITEASLDSARFTFEDAAYSGMYAYDPSVFATGKQFQIDIYDARDPGRIHKTILLPETSKFIQQIRRDFDYLNGVDMKVAGRERWSVVPGQAPAGFVNAAYLSKTPTGLRLELEGAAAETYGTVADLDWDRSRWVGSAATEKCNGPSRWEMTQGRGEALSISLTCVRARQESRITFALTKAGQ